MRWRARPGLGESITQRLDGAYAARSVSIINGYAKSDEAFCSNGCIRRATIGTSRGYKATVTLEGYARAAARELSEREGTLGEAHSRRGYPGTHADDPTLNPRDGARLSATISRWIA